uniref:RNA polymerase II-associated factor 1 homolog n=1 Tax=Anas platyrhynchos TaxID=8839 RepID=A0A8B9SXN1_ANAPL
KYCNSLPDIPFDPSSSPTPSTRTVQGHVAGEAAQHDLLTEPDLGVTIDLINPDTYRIDPSVLLDPADEKLLRRRIQAPTSSKSQGTQHAKVVPWMCARPSTSPPSSPLRVSNEKPEVSEIGVSVKQQFTEEEIYKDPRQPNAAIEKLSRTPKMWINPCAQVIFDSDPAPKDTSGPSDLLTLAARRGMMDEEGNQFVAYFLPVEETLRSASGTEEEMDYSPQDVYDYKISSKGYEENYFFIFREGDGVYYNELETRWGGGAAGVQSGTNAVLVVKHPRMNEKELEAQEARRAQLENHEPRGGRGGDGAEKEAPGSVSGGGFFLGGGLLTLPLRLIAPPPLLSRRGAGEGQRERRGREREEEEEAKAPAGRGPLGCFIFWGGGAPLISPPHTHKDARERWGGAGGVGGAWSAGGGKEGRGAPAEGGGGVRWSRVLSVPSAGGKRGGQEGKEALPPPP